MEKGQLGVAAESRIFTRLVVAAAIVDTMETMKPAYPKVTEARKAGLARARELMLTEKR